MLTKRLSKLVDSLPKSDVIADVGCDHGYVGIEALKRGLARRVVFVDISDECLQKARTNCPQGLKSSAEFVCQDGLGQIECDTAVICGMGGLEILSVLNGAKRMPQAVVLQPMRNIVDVRKYLCRHYVVTLDETFFDGKYYTVMRGEQAGSYDVELDELQLNFGVSNMLSPGADFVAYLKNEQQKLQQILSKCSDGAVRRKLDLTQRALDKVLGK